MFEHGYKKSLRYNFPRPPHARNRRDRNFAENEKFAGKFKFRNAGNFSDGERDKRSAATVHQRRLYGLFDKTHRQRETRKFNPRFVAAGKNFSQRRDGRKNFGRRKKSGGNFAGLVEKS